ncbi:phytoene desaturase [Rhodocytophaga rosea]|uniref:Phytoene desaturase n=1 Tax=Rhodocytophaga rosea TaxID=2704465 RepID=A0A6C0GNH8_9BACT|nr:phytoene desaturase family protein [Rhodocytophaga rosea]QHT69183.1 phytoene desaturase [Rhodocytophaga rosea]
MPKKKVIVIGSGFAGIAAATTLATQGFQVTVLEKNEGPGGRARVFQAEGFTFDMGPSWYWMPDVFESYFNRFGKSTSDYYQLIRLDPSYTVIFGENEFVDIPAELKELYALFESFEPGSSTRLQAFLEQAAYKYKVGINNLVYKPSRSLTEFIDFKLLIDVFRMDVFQSFHQHIRKFFHHEKILKLMEFPVLFLGAVPENTPALYSLMNYADISLGTWYPMGGMHKIVEGMVKLAEEKGVQFIYNADVQKIEVAQGIANKVITQNQEYEADIIVAGADYHHVEKNLLPAGSQSYTEDYWNKRIMAPSSLIFYLGINKRLQNLRHHNLFFDEDFKIHAREIYEIPRWPSRPLFYVSVPSKTDVSVAPEGCENVFILIPVAPELEDTPAIREKYYEMVMNRLEKLTGQPIRNAVIFKRSYAHQDFKADYNAFKGNAYGLANTLMQTAILKPSLKSKKVKNLYYTGQLTVPGPGVPPSLISGQVVAEEIRKEYGR